MGKFCGNCGTPAGDNETFCSNCGAPLGEPAAATVTPKPVNAVPADAPMESAPVDNGQPEQESGAAQQDSNTYQQPVNAYDQTANTYQQPANTYDQPAFNNGGATAQPGNKKLLPIIIAAVAAVIVLIVVIAVIKVATRFEKIDAKELFDIEFAGPDGYGVCYAQLDVDPNFAYDEYGVYMEDYSISVKGEDSSKVKYSGYFADKRSTLEDTYKKASDKDEAEDMRDELLKVNKKTGEFKLTCKVSKENGLKNGDKVTVTVDYDEDSFKEENIKLENTEFEVEVKGLEKAETIEPFADFSPEFTGNDGYGYVSYDYNSTKYDFVSYSLDTYDKNYALSNGDKLTLSAYIYVGGVEYLDDEDTSKGYWFKYNDKLYVWPYGDTVTQEFTVEGLKELEEIDPFEGIEFSFSGALPYLKISYVEVPEDSVLYGNVSYSFEDVDYDTRLKLGDTFTVKCYAYSSLADEGYKLKGTPDDEGYVSKEFTVDETMPTYIDGSYGTDDLKDADSVFEDLAEDYKNGISGSYLSGGASLDSSVQSVTSMKMIAQYVINPEGFASGSIADGTYNYYGRLYELDLKLKEGTTKAYVYIYTSNVSVYNGQVYVGSNPITDTSDYYFSKVSAVKKNDLIKTLKEEGTLTELTAGSAASTDSSSAADTSSVADSSAADSTAASADESAASSAADSASDTSVADSLVP